MIVKMRLLSDTVLGNGQSVPGGEDISINHDKDGFPYYSGSALRGILREEMINYLSWTGKDENEIEKKIETLFGKSDMFYSGEEQKVRVSDFMIPERIREVIKNEVDNREEVLNSFTYLRKFTSINENGVADKGSLRTVRCLIQGMSLYGEIGWPTDEEEEILKNALSCIKWVGSMRNRGFGNVDLSIFKGGTSDGNLS